MDFALPQEKEKNILKTVSAICEYFHSPTDETNLICKLCKGTISRGGDMKHVSEALFHFLCPIECDFQKKQHQLKENDVSVHLCHLSLFPCITLTLKSCQFLRVRERVFMNDPSFCRKASKVKHVSEALFHFLCPI